MKNVVHIQNECPQAKHLLQVFCKDTLSQSCFRQCNPANNLSQGSQENFQILGKIFFEAAHCSQYAKTSHPLTLVQVSFLMLSQPFGIPE